MDGLQNAVRLLQELGHDVVEAAPQIDRDAFTMAFLTIVAAEARADMERAARSANCKPTFADFDTGTYGLGLMGRVLSASDYANAMRYLKAVARHVGQFFELYDVLLTPTLSQPPVQIGALRPSGEGLLKLFGWEAAGWLLKILGVLKPLMMQMSEKTWDFMPYTALFNVTGQPAMSVPLHWNAAGLPIGMQFVGRFGDEGTLFRLAGQLEQARPWFDHSPTALN
jgi:amidase